MADSATSSRRDFLLGAGLGTAAALALPATRHPTPVAADAARPESPSGYRASPHVLKYYETTQA